jgi:hypothetical protein
MIILLLILFASFVVVYPIGMYLCYYHDEVWVTTATFGKKFRIQEKI